MLSAKIAGAILLALPALVAAAILFWRRQRTIFWFTSAMVLVGTGYLATTGATDDIARKLVPGLITR